MGERFDTPSGTWNDPLMANVPEELNDALLEALRRLNQEDMARSVRELIGQYRGEFDPSRRALASEINVAAYAAYRMPATYAAVVTAMRRTAALMPGFQPRTHVDIGGGTGAAMWAAAEVWPSLRETVVLEQAEHAIALGRRLARRAGSAAVREATWRRTVIDGAVRCSGADLITMTYVLGELPPDVRDAAVRSLVGAAETIVLVEPGTPAGYERIVAARAQLLEQGLSMVAPCPHDRECPIPRGKDWCHFSARLNRTALHRKIKSGTLGFEDEKFSYVAASTGGWQRADNRVLRHPLKRKGLVSMRLCTGTDGLQDRVVSKKQGDVYRAARDIDWGDAWPPGGEPSA